MKLADFDFYLPKELIAKRPLIKRDSSRLLVLHKDGHIEHKRFFDLLEYLNQGDMLLINNTKVFPARLRGYKRTGDTLDILLVREKEGNLWEILSKGRYTGTIRISEELEAEIYDGMIAKFKCSGNIKDKIWRYGDMPLPPYIRRLPDEEDKETYQTVYAKKEGSMAAPTAGLHFTEELLYKLILKGVIVKELTLHVGIGTFRPIRKTYIEQHVMEPEFFEIEKSLISEIEEVKSMGKRIFAVGTTTTRAVEGFLSGKWSELGETVSKYQCVKVSGEKINNSLEPSNPGSPKSFRFCPYKNNGSISGFTDIFIYPGYKFKAISSLITNFHLPKSTPLMLVAAFCGREKLKKAYEEAVSLKYRFFSYGDAMLIL